MNTYYTLEEKYLQAVDKYSYGKTTKALRLLTEIIANEPLYARAHYQLGKIYYYEMEDYQTAGYHFKICMEVEPSFPDVYYHYLQLVVFLNMEKLANTIAAKALTVPGVNLASVYKFSGLIAEKNKHWAKAIEAYQRAFIEVTDKKQIESIEESLTRVRSKIQRSKIYLYNLIE